MSDRLTAWAAKWRIPAEALVELAIAVDDVEAATDLTSEAGVQRACRLEADRLGGVLLRNNSGATFDRNKRMIRYGLGNDSKKLNMVYKSSDLIGICPKTCRCGQRFGVFFACENKKPGWTHPVTDRDFAQANFHNHVRSLGGIAIFATDPAHVRAAMS